MLLNGTIEMKDLKMKINFGEIKSDSCEIFVNKL